MPGLERAEYQAGDVKFRPSFYCCFFQGCLAFPLFLLVCGFIEFKVRVLSFVVFLLLILQGFGYCLAHLSDFLLLYHFVVTHSNIYTKPYYGDVCDVSLDQM